MSWKGDPNAFHQVVDGEIAGLTEKATPVDADLVVIEDSADGNSKKKAQLGNLPGGGGGGGLTTLIDETVLASDTTTVSFTSIPSTSDELRLEIAGRSIRSGAEQDSPRVRFGNGSIDSGSNYDSWGEDAASTVSQVAATSAQMRFSIPAASALTNLYSALTVVIPQYAHTGHLKSFWFYGGFFVSGNSRLVKGVGTWRSTSAIDTIDLFLLNDDWAAGSVFRLYGVG